MQPPHPPWRHPSPMVASMSYTMRNQQAGGRPVHEMHRRQYHEEQQPPRQPLHRHHHHQQQQQQQQQALRLKCIILGSAGAGKTSLLRRYVHGSFEDHHVGVDDNSNAAATRGGVANINSVTTGGDNNNSGGGGTVTGGGWSSRTHRGKRSTTSTLGADYYVKRMKNPLFGERIDTAMDCRCGCSRCGDLRSGGVKEQTDGDGKDVEHQKDLQISLDTTSTVAEHQHTPQDNLSQPQQPYQFKATTESHCQVQLWDTRGKEQLAPSLNLQKQHKTLNIFQFLSLKASDDVATNNSNYEHRYNNWGVLHGVIDDGKGMNLHSTTSSATHNTQNTHHKHGHPLHYHHHNLKQRRNAPLGDALFRNIDACMLVYDATSSMSFLQLMQWHEEWMKRLRYWEMEESEGDGQAEDVSVEECVKRRVRSSSVPFIVVANKIDLLYEENNGAESVSNAGNVQSRRSVMKFEEGKYKGKELVYEYAAKNASSSSCDCGKCSCLNQGIKGKTQSKSLNARSKTELHSAKPLHSDTPLTYSLQETTWSTDTYYLRSLQLAEEQLPANRSMILLWCQRNGIPHVEASALDGRGVDEAMQQLVKMGVEELGKREMAVVMKKEYEDMKRIEQERQDVLAMQPVDNSSYLHTEESAMQRTADISIDNNAIVNDNTPVGNNNVHPSQQYFLYQPRYEKKLDLFARYSPKSEKSCFLHCWPLFSYCSN